MLATKTAQHHNWSDFWDHLQRAEEVWAARLGGDGQLAFASAIESMIRASVHPDHRDELYQAWRACSGGRCWLWEESDLCMELRIRINNPYAPVGPGACEILRHLKFYAGQDGVDAVPAPGRDVTESAAVAFVGQLKYAVLATMWQFERCCSTYLASIPPVARKALDSELYDLVIQELLRE